MCKIEFLVPEPKGSSEALLLKVQVMDREQFEEV